MTGAVHLQCGIDSDLRTVILDVPADKKIGLMMGGGMDSSLLLHLLTKYFPQVHLTVFSIDKLDEPNHAKRVIDTLGVGDKITHAVKPFIETGESQAYAYLVRDMLKNKVVDYMFTASNATPEEGILQTSFTPPARHKENPFPNTVGLPFLHLLKYHILDLYYREGVEHILPLTHSCTETGDGGCGVCWWCKEREWAFSMLGKQFVPGR